MVPDLILQIKIIWAVHELSSHFEMEVNEEKRNSVTLSRLCLHLMWAQIGEGMAGI